MLPPVIVDLGAEVGARDAQIVLSACNEAIANGVCLPEGSPEGERPRAIAVARAADRRVLVVRIEVRLAPSSEAEVAPDGAPVAGGAAARGPIVRQIRFAPRDPLRERWRSVGLAIATLVGEGERRAREDEAVPAPDAIDPSASAPASPATSPDAPDVEGVAPGSPSEAPAAAPASRRDTGQRPSAPSGARQAAGEPAEQPAELARAPDERASGDEPNGEDGGDRLDAGAAGDAGARERTPFEHRPLFLGLGVLTGPGFGAGAWRAGGNLRGGWQHPAGWQIALSLGAAWRTSRAPFTAAWLSLDAGVGYRWAASDAVSFGALVFGGAEAARFEVLARGEASTEVRWTPRVGLSLDGRWRLRPSFGAWLAADVASPGRETRLFIAADREPIVASPIEIALALGIAWWPE